MKPLYTHDCKECVYLGTIARRDLYYCGKWSPTLVARCGSRYFQYRSGLRFGKSGLDYVLWIAYLIAKQKGYINE